MADDLPPVATVLPLQRSQACYKDTNCPPKATSPETVVAPQSLSCLAGHGWLHPLDEWLPFEAACSSDSPISVEVFKYLLQPLNILLYFSPGMKEQA